MVKNLLESINLIKIRIDDIKETIKDFKENKVLEKYYYDSLKLNLIEIGEESKILNDEIKKIKGEWDNDISLSYNFRISLTHYYKKMNKEIIKNYLNKKFNKFIKKIEILEKKFQGGNK